MIETTHLEQFIKEGLIWVEDGEYVGKSGVSLGSVGDEKYANDCLMEDIKREEGVL